VHNQVQLAALEHSLQLARPQALSILALAQLLQWRHFVLVSLCQHWADIVRPVWVRLLECQFDAASLDLGERRPSRANVDGRELSADGCVCGLWSGLRGRLQL